MPACAAARATSSRPTKKNSNQVSDDGGSATYASPTVKDNKGDAIMEVTSVAEAASDVRTAVHVVRAVQPDSAGAETSAARRSRSAIVVQQTQGPWYAQRGKPGVFYYKPLAKASYDHSYAQAAIAALIILNFGFNIAEKEVDPSGTNYPDFFGRSEDVFNILFIIELLWNMYANFFKDFICSSWNVFDSVVVIVGVLSLARVLSGPLLLLRCLRALRVFRLFKRIKSLRKILASIVSAVPGVVNAFAVVIIVISIYSIVAVEFFYNFDQHPVTIGNETQIECYYYNYMRPMVDGQLERIESVTPRGLCFSEEYYGTFLRAWYTLFQILTGDSWAEVIARPVLYGWDSYAFPPAEDTVAEPYVFNGVSNFISGIFFMTFVLINSFVLINVVVAVLLDKMVSESDDDEDDDDEEPTRPPPPPPPPESVTGRWQKELADEQKDLGLKIDAMTKALLAVSKALDVAPEVVHSAPS